MSPKEFLPEPSIPDLLNELFYPGESDEPIVYVDFSFNFDPPLTIGQVRDFLLITPEIYVEERTEEEFWLPVVTEQDWYAEEEEERTTRFVELQHHLRSVWSNCQVFRIGETEVDLYLLGRKEDGCWAGLKTMVVET